MRNKRIYLAIPYNGMKKLSYKVANTIAGKLIDKGNIVFSPISHSHPIWLASNRRQSWKTWLEQDKEFVKWCDEVHIIRVGKKGNEKIRKSKGVQQEILWANEFQKKIKFINYKIN